MPTEGVVYICAADDLLAEAERSAESVQETNPGLEITLITNEDIDSAVFDDIQAVDSVEGGFSDKPRSMELPYDKTLYLDTDTYVNRSLKDIFDVLDRFDIAAVQNYTNTGRNTAENDSVPASFPEFNTGVIGFKDTPAVQAFLEDWRDAFMQRDDLRPGDQPSFREVLYHSDLRIATLPTEYNCLFRYPSQVTGDVAVFHGRLGDYDSEGASEQYPAQRAIEAISKQSTTRVSVPKATGGFRVLDARGIGHQLRTRYSEQGLRGVVRGVYEKLPF